MEKKEFYYPSADGATQIHATKWMPDEAPRAVLQIIHGMTEYVGRYEAFAEFMCNHGFVVVGEDHLGHGLSVQDKMHYGYFGDKGNEWMIQDIHQLRLATQKEYEGLPYMMLGHSMGSFLVRQYIVTNDAQYADGLTGVVVMGTGWQPGIAMTMGKTLAKMLGTDKLGKTASAVEAVAFGSYLKRIKNPRSSKDWLTRDEAIVDKYRQDDLCMFHFTANGFYHMFSGMEKAHDIKAMKKLPAGLPILFTSGGEDPVGSYGEGVRKAYMVYSENTDCEVSIEIYPEDRHEILNELDKDKVYSDLLDFAEHCLSK